MVVRAQDDGVGDPYKLRLKLSEPTRCPACGAVYQEGRWQWMELPPANAHAEIRERLITTPHSRLPAGEGSPDQMIGVVKTSDLLVGREIEPCAF
jgi:hypothetical protein